MGWNSLDYIPLLNSPTTFLLNYALRLDPSHCSAIFPLTWFFSDLSSTWCQNDFLKE